MIKGWILSISIANSWIKIKQNWRILESKAERIYDNVFPHWNLSSTLGYDHWPAGYSQILAKCSTWICEYFLSMKQPKHILKFITNLFSWDLFYSLLVKMITILGRKANIRCNSYETENQLHLCLKIKPFQLWIHALRNVIFMPSIELFSY